MKKNRFKLHLFPLLSLFLKSGGTWGQDGKLIKEKQENA